MWDSDIALAGEILIVFFRVSCDEPSLAIHNSSICKKKGFSSHSVCMESCCFAANIVFGTLDHISDYIIGLIMPRRDTFMH